MRRRTSTLRPLLCAGLLSLTLLLAGCAEADPQPKFEKPAASPTVAKEETAEEFIKRWNDEQNKMIAGQPNMWREMTSACSSCITSADRVESYYAAGGYAQTKGRRIMSIKADPKVERGSYLFEVEVVSAPTKYRESSTSAEKSLPGGRYRYDVTLNKEAGEWRFVNYLITPN